ncbi:MAG: NAD-dependent epimerase/dehydratase family protein [Terracidiphilus sp.]
MTILITGGGGMVGRNLLVMAPSLHRILAPPRAELDLRDEAALSRYLSRHRPDLIIHAAGRVGGIQANLDAPVDFLIENLEIGRNVILQARDHGVARLLNLASSCMYPRDCEEPLREEQILTGELEPTNEGYALAKIVIARLCVYINRQCRGLSYKTVIPCNLYGQFDKFDLRTSHLIPATIVKIHEAQLAARQEVTIWGDGRARREFLYASDAAAMLWHAVERFDDLQPLLNLGAGRDHTVTEYYKATAESLGYRGAFRYDLARPVGMKRKLLNCERMAQLGFPAPRPLREGIALTCSHFLAEVVPRAGAGAGVQS